MRRRALFLSGAMALAARASGAQPRPDWLPEGQHLIREFTEGEAPSKLARRREGERVSVRGFMAPPLKADAGFFVLTHAPMAVCPFCSEAAEWPDSILLVRPKRALRPVPYTRQLLVTGVLGIGEERDAETGFVSLVRLTDARVEEA
jgi:hypothetical protein